MDENDDVLYRRNTVLHSHGCRKFLVCACVGFVITRIKDGATKHEAGHDAEVNAFEETFENGVCTEASIVQSGIQPCEP